MTRYPHKHTSYRCGGYSSDSGHCGAMDCDTCHPGGAARMRCEGRLAELEEEMEILCAKRSALVAIIEAADQRQFDTYDLEVSLEDIDEVIYDVQGNIYDAEDGVEDEEEEDFAEPDYM